MKDNETVKSEAEEANENNFNEIKKQFMGPKEKGGNAMII